MLLIVFSSYSQHEFKASNNAFVTRETYKDGYKITISTVLSIQSLLVKEFLHIFRSYK